MVKSFLIIIICQVFIYAGEQMILVVSDSYNSKKATLSCFEDGVKVFDSFKVNIGENGLGWGIEEKELLQGKKEPLKYEGDKKAPIGIFALESIFGYEKDLKTKMPYLYATKNLICVDDPDSKFYNQIITITKERPKSFEYMKRDDGQYELGIVVGYNKKQIKQRGSCIFLHVEKSKGASTAGCTSMSLENIRKIVSWLDKSKNPILIQITHSQLDQILKLYPNLRL